jgi:hypothetical protein
MRRAISDGLLSACALATLLVVLMAFDGRVREQVRMQFDSSARASSEVASVGLQARELVDVIIEAAKVQSRQHRPLMLVVLAGTVLTIFMLRT